MGTVRLTTRGLLEAELQARGSSLHEWAADHGVSPEMVVSAAEGEGADVALDFAVRDELGYGSWVRRRGGERASVA